MKQMRFKKKNALTLTNSLMLNKVFFVLGIISTYFFLKFTIFIYIFCSPYEIISNRLFCGENGFTVVSHSFSFYAILRLNFFYIEQRIDLMFFFLSAGHRLGL